MVWLPGSGKSDDILSRFGTLPACDGETAGHRHSMQSMARSV